MRIPSSLFSNNIGDVKKAFMYLPLIHYDETRSFKGRCTKKLIT